MCRALVLPLAHGFYKPALQARADLVSCNYTNAKGMV